MAQLRDRTDRAPPGSQTLCKAVWPSPPAAASLLPDVPRVPSLLPQYWTRAGIILQTHDLPRGLGGYVALGVLGLSDNWIKTDSLAPLPAQATLSTPQLLPGSHPQHPGSKGLHRRGCRGGGRGAGGAGLELM